MSARKNLLVAVAEFFLHLADQILHALAGALGADQRGVGGVNDDHVADADGGDEMFGFSAEDDVFVAVDEETAFTIDGVVVLIGAERLGQAGPGTDVKPL